MVTFYVVVAYILSYARGSIVPEEVADTRWEKQSESMLDVYIYMYI